MAVKIRLRRMGAKKAPFYRIVVADSRFPRDGRFIEEIGYYDPMKQPSLIKLDLEKANHWIATGAQPTDTVKKLIKIASEAPAPAPVPAEAPADTAPAAPDAPAEQA